LTKELQFPISEYEGRVEKARALMKERGIDALVVGTGPNLTYFSGYPSPTKSVSRPFILLLPGRGEPSLVLQEGRLYEAKRFSWVEDVRTYHKLSHLPREILIDLLREKRLESGVVGIESGNEMEPNFPIWELLGLKADLPNITFTDASELIWKLRIVKSPLELELISHACAITTRAYARCFSQLRAGMSESDAAHLFAIAHLEEGGSSPWFNITSGPGNYDLASKPPGKRRLDVGDLIWFDGGCSVGGYYSDFSRAAVVGRASTGQRRAQDTVNLATEAGLNAIRPGIGVAEVSRVCNRVLDEAGLTITSSISGLAARVGHGLGLVATEPPSVSEDDPTILRPGMVVTVEPGIATSEGLFHHEHNVIVTEDGHEIISHAPTSLFEIPIDV
jgi:Xaa-Pro aminopeptidase